MSGIDRRQFVGSSALGLIGLASDGAAAAQGAREPAPPSVVPSDVTKTLAAYVVRAQPEDLPAPVRREACRTLLNWAGCAVGGSRHETVDHRDRALRPFSGAPQASRARTQRAAGHPPRVADERHQLARARLRRHASEDRHPPRRPGRVRDPGAGGNAPVSGRDFLHALVLGAEVECRIGNAVYPAHYDRGWHITGTAGVFGAAAACGRCSDCRSSRCVWALGLAATQPVGLREMFGTMTKSFHPGRAAQNGLTAAVLAKEATSPAARSASKGGPAGPRAQHHLRLHRRSRAASASLRDLLNTYKPFACGIVLHPIIDACLQLRREHTAHGRGDRAHRAGACIRSCSS